MVTLPPFWLLPLLSLSLPQPPPLLLLLLP
jgi:hypothetical protein